MNKPGDLPYDLKMMAVSAEKFELPVIADAMRDAADEIEQLRAAKDDLKIWIAQVLERGHLTVEIIEDARRLLRDNQQTTRNLTEDEDAKVRAAIRASSEPID